MTAIRISADRLARLETRIEPEPNTGCWLWTGWVSDRGYGLLWDTASGAKKQARAHRIVYEALHGPIPEGTELDHRCRERSCVNPDHLDPVSHAENVRRGASIQVVAHRNGACLRGHSLTDPANAYRRPDTGRLSCRRCRNERKVARRRLVSDSPIGSGAGAEQ